MPLESQQGRSRAQSSHWTSSSSRRARFYDDDDENRPSKYDPSPLEQQFANRQAASIRQSIQVLTVVVSLFFVATWAASNGRLLATPPPSQTSGGASTIINADELLQQDWERSNRVLINEQ